MPIEIFVSVSQISMIVAVMTAEFFAKNDNRLGKRYVVRDLPEAEMSHHLGYKKSERSDSDNTRNGHKSKRVNSSYGNFSMKVPQERPSRR